jgi:hypothetical protein
MDGVGTFLSSVCSRVVLSRAQDPPGVGVGRVMEAKDPGVCSGPWPPGDFMDEELEEGTKRFVEHARELARRRSEERPWDELDPDDDAG